jgi:DNA polymerase-4
VLSYTYTADLPSLQCCVGQLPELFGKLSERLLVLDSSYRISKQFIKLKSNNFQSATMECLSSGRPRMAVFNHLCQQLFARGEGLPVRLIGVGVRFQDKLWNSVQLPLFDEGLT